MADEKGRRRDTFAGGVPVVLGDGQPWHLPKPKVGLAHEVGPDGTLRFGKTRRSFGEAYDALLDVYLEAEDGPTEINALLALAVDLLARNYDLGGDDFRDLLPRWLDDEPNTEMWTAIADVAVGRSPKPIPVG